MASLDGTIDVFALFALRSGNTVMTQNKLTPFLIKLLQRVLLSHKYVHLFMLQYMWLC